MMVLRRIVWRSIIGLGAGIVIGAISAVLLVTVLPKEWIGTWKTETKLDEYHLAWILWAAVTGIVAIVSLFMGCINLGRRFAFVIRGVLCGCVAGTMLTFFAAWLRDEWPFPVKGPETMISIGRNFVLPGFAVIGGIVGRIWIACLERRDE
jgi:hypothetical protein